MTAVVTGIENIKSYVTAKVSPFWNHWNLHVFLLTSFGIQLFLIVVAPLRKQSSNAIILFFIWATYLLADWIAIQGVGFIPKRPTKGAEGDVQGFWAQFLLVHLGGPDTITALALQDNDLWLRTGLHLGAQVYASVRILSIAVKQSSLRIPTGLMFLAGVIKYSERVYALYCGQLIKCDEEPDECAVKLEKYEPKNWDLASGLFKDRQNEPSNPNTQAPMMANESNLDGSAEEGEGTPSPEGLSQTHTQPELSSRPLDTSPTGRKRIVGPTNVEMVRHAYFFFNYYKGLYDDRVFKVHEWQTSMGYFLRRTPTEAFKVLEMELNFAYEAFYTKMVIPVMYGMLLRLFVLALEVVSLVLWTCSLTDDKRHISRRNIRITRCLLIGAIVMDVLAFFRILFSNWNIACLDRETRFSTLCNWFLGLWDRTWGERRSREEVRILSRFKRVFFKRWSESISQFNLINVCLDKQSLKVIKLNKHFPALGYCLDGLMYVDAKWFSDELRDFIFEELRPGIVDQHEPGLYENILTGKDWAAWCKDLEDKGFEYPLSMEDMEFDECLLTLHIATEICYQSEAAALRCNNENHSSVAKSGLSKVISDYMFYLLIRQPKMMSSIAGSSKVRYRDTCAHLREVLQRREFLDLRAEKERAVRHQKTCNHLLKCHDTIDRDGISESVLLKAVKVARHLRKRLMGDKEKTWELTARLWVAILFYAARHCKPSAHASRLKGGGELLTLVWLLSVQFGLGQPFKLHKNSDHTV